MIKEALEYIVEIVNGSSHVTQIHRTPKNITLVNCKGVVSNVEKPPIPLDATANDLDSLVALATAEKSTVWHNRKGVELVIDSSEGSYRSDRVKWNLSCSSKFDELRSGKCQCDHKSFVRYIVQNFRDELESLNPGVLGSLRSLKFATSDTQENDIQHGKESMGRSINREVTGASDLPETVVLEVRRWAELDIFVKVELMLIVDAEKKTLELRPLADSAKRADIEANKTLGDMIREKVKCLVMHGSSN